MALPTLNVTPGTGAVINTLQTGGQATPGNSHPFTLDNSVETAPGVAGALAVTVQGNASSIAVPVSLPAAVQTATGTTAINAITVQGNASGIPQPSSVADGGSVALGSKADVAWVSGAGSAIAILKTIASNPVTLGSLGASENHIGATGGEGIHLTVSPSGSTTAYTTGLCIGGLQTVAGFVRITGKSVLIQSAQLRCLTASLNSEIDVYIFRQQPLTVTGLTDHNAFNVVASEATYVSKVIKFTSYDSIGGAVISNVDGIGKYMNLSSGTTAYVQLVSRGSFTLGANTDITLSLGLIAD